MQKVMVLLWIIWIFLRQLAMPVEGDVQVGAAFNVFTSFGDLGAEVKVKGPGDPWYPGHSTNVFEQVMETRSPIFSSNREFNGDFLLQLCDDVTKLKAALFLAHKLEGAERPWRAFAGGWSRSVTAAHLGVNSTYLLGNHKFVLVRLTRHHEQVMLSPDYDRRFNPWTEQGATQVVPELPETVFDFINKFGSHYVSSYVSGDSLYQVFVFVPTVYELLYNAMRDYEETGQGLDQVLEFFTPWHTEHIGRIVCLSGNISVERWAEQHLRSKTLVFDYSSLLELQATTQRGRERLRSLNTLMGNDALLEVELKSLAPFFLDERKHLWFSEILNNHMKLWEVSI